MRLPRDLTGAELVQQLVRLGYAVTRQTGTHMRLACRSGGGGRHVTVPKGNPLRIGSLAAILDAVAAHQGVSQDEFLQRLSR